MSTASDRERTPTVSMFDVITPEIIAIADPVARREAVLAERRDLLAKAAKLQQYADHIVAQLAETASQRNVAQVTKLSKTAVQRKSSGRKAS